jgi:YidC/Oxa1 family membrane protein insertase
MHLLREIADFSRFFWKTKKAEKAIVIYTEHGGYYPSFEGLIEQLTVAHNQSLCYVTSDPNDPIFQILDSRIKTFYLNKLLIFFMSFVNCKVFIMTLTDLNQYHLKRSANPVHYVYVFHAMVSTHMIYRYGSFDHYDTILCVGPHQKKEICRHEEINGLATKELIEAGYYRLERIYQAYQKYQQVKHSPSKKATILVAPSWGLQNILESCGEDLVEILLEAGYKVIVRPHPETLRQKPEVIEFLSSKFGNNSHFTLETSVAMDDSILRADILICDYSGIALEYAFGTERPVLFLDVPKKIRNQRYKELGIEPLELSIRPEIGVVVSPEKLDTVPQNIAVLLANKEKYQQKLARLRAQIIYAFGHSSQVGAQYILDIVQGKEKKIGMDGQ